MRVRVFYKKELKMKHITLRFSVIILLIINAFSLSAQELDALPKGLTEVERELLPQFQFTNNRIMSDPPYWSC